MATLILFLTFFFRLPSKKSSPPNIETFGWSGAIAWWRHVVQPPSEVLIHISSASPRVRSHHHVSTSMDGGTMRALSRGGVAPPKALSSKQHIDRFLGVLADVFFRSIQLIHILKKMELPHIPINNSHFLGISINFFFK